MIVKKHMLDDNSLMLAICDKNLIGKKIKEGKINLDLNSEFYKGEPLNKKELEKIVKKARIINAVGEKSVAFLQEKKLIKKISFIKKIPYAQLSRL